MTPPVDPVRGIPDTAGVLRVALLTARDGMTDELLVAAHTNAAEARRAPGCQSADVCLVPDRPAQVVVCSRWASPTALSAFLGWHEGIAHRLIAQASSDRPAATHYPIVAPPER